MLRFGASVQGASWALLALMIAVSVVVTGAAAWAMVQIGRRRGGMTELAVLGVSTLVGALVVVARSSPVVVREAGGVLEVLDQLGLCVAGRGRGGAPGGAGARRAPTRAARVGHASTDRR